MTQPSDYDDDVDLNADDDQQDSRITLSRQQIKALERDAKRARAADEENAQIKRELAFARVGADFTDKQQKALLANVEGDLTTESIRAAAEELGFLQPAAPKPSDDAARRIASASGGSTSESDEDPVARLLRADREGGKAGLLAELSRNGVLVSDGG